jgi:hypothetical protein
VKLLAFQLAKKFSVSQKFSLFIQSEIPIRLHREAATRLSSPIQTQIKVKVKDSRNRPGVAQRVPGILGSQTSLHSAHEGGEVVSPTHRPPLHSGNVPGTHFH